MRENSVRLRLSKSEVKSLQQTGQVMERVSFIDTILTYQIKSHVQSFFLANMNLNEISIFMPQEISAIWYDIEDIGYNYIQKNNDGSELHILIEKDFVCLDRTDEDQSDNYANPKAVC